MNKETNTSIREKGHWIERTDWQRIIGTVTSECSVCHTIFHGKKRSRGDGKGGKFCEECGADMRGKEPE